MRKVIGIHSVLEVFKIRPNKIESLFLKKDYSQNPKLKEIFDLSLKFKIKPKIVDPQSLDRIGDGHQGVAVDVLESPSIPWDQIEKSNNCLLLGLDGLEDPQNLGNILRTAWLLGVDGILMTENRSVSLTPSVCKIASGGAEHVGIETYNQLIEPLKQLKKQGFWIYGMSEKAKSSIWNEKIHEKAVIIVGSEVKGMKPQTQNECDVLIKIPQIEASASLNVATSVAIGIADWNRRFKK
jgi:23S rRNA (guanosine2251-2'-O)-methyltransferase